MKRNDQTRVLTGAAAMLLAGGLAVLSVGCDETGNGAATALPDAAPAAPPVAAPPVAAAPPRIEFDTLTYDFGRVAETTMHRGRLAFRNAGGSPLVIDEIKTTCGCTAVALEKREYAAGESGTLEIEFDPVAPGDQKKYINVISNDASSPITKITMIADVIAFVDIEPRMITLDNLRYGEEHHATVTVTGADPAFTIDSVTTSNPDVTVEIVGGEGDTRTLDLSVDASAPWGGLFAWLTVTVTGRPTPDAAPITHTSRARIQGSIFGEIQATPHTFRFGAAPGEAFERTVALRRADGTPFRVLESRVTKTDLPEATVRIEPGTLASAYEIVLSVTAPTRLAGYRGDVEITTDVPGEERIVIPISGVVRNEPSGIK